MHIYTSFYHSTSMYSGRCDTTFVSSRHSARWWKLWKPWVILFVWKMRLGRFFRKCPVDALLVDCIVLISLYFQRSIYLYIYIHDYTYIYIHINNIYHHISTDVHLQALIFGISHFHRFPSWLPGRPGSVGSCERHRRCSEWSSISNQMRTSNRWITESFSKMSGSLFFGKGSGYGYGFNSYIFNSDHESW